MQEICCKLGRLGAVVVLFLAVSVGSAWAQIPWQTNDVVTCYGSGNCNVFRIVGNTPNLLNPLNDGHSGDVHGAAINNTLHLLVTDNDSGSNVVQFSIASINPFDGTTVPHSTTTFNGGGGPDSKNAQAIAINNVGHMFVGNSGSNGGQASIVELDAHGTATGNVYTFSSGPCATSSLNSLDLKADGNMIYITSGDVQTGGDGKIRALDISNGLSAGSCTIFADFGPGVSLFGIKDIPDGALADNCPFGGNCPSGDSLLVVAKGFVDLDKGETGENSETGNPDAVNVCTNSLGDSPESCALLLSTATQTTPLSGAVWTAGNPYNTDTTTTILDAYLHVQRVYTLGTAGSDEPIWAHDSGAIVRDNAVVWKDLGTPVLWASHHAYSQGNLTIGAGHVQQETEATCTSGVYATVFSTPAWSTNTSGGTLVDGTCKWTDLGVAGTWGADTPYVTNNAPYTGQLVTASGNVQQVQIAGTSGPSTPAFSITVGGTVTDGLQWQDQGLSPAILATYRVQAGDTLQALALDPLVTDCTGNQCQNTFTPNRKLANFWMADTGSGSIFKVAFADGTHQTYDTNLGGGCPNGGCGSSIHSIVIYGGESAAQPGLASLLLGGSLVSPNFTATQTILGNTITSTLYGTSLPTTPIALYASLVPTSSCFNDSNVGSLPCRATVASDTTKSLVWKIDIPQGQAAALPSAQTLNTALVGPLANPPITPPSFGIDNGTDVFVDMGFDDTTFVGSDPGTRTVSVHSLHEVGGVSFGVSGCKFSSPLPNTCYKLNRSTLNFIFSCPGLSTTTFDSLNPVLSLVKKDPNHVQAPQFIPLSKTNGTNGKATFRLDAAHNIYTFQLNLSGFAAGTYLGTAFDLSNQVQSFTTQNFRLDSTCK